MFRHGNCKGIIVRCNRVSNAIFVLLAAATLAACNPEISADIYAGDIIEVAENGKPLMFPVRLSMPIQNVKNCEKDKDKMLPALKKYGTKTTFLSCTKLSGEMHDLMHVEMEAEVIKGTVNGPDLPSGMFGLIIRHDVSGKADIHFIKTPAADNAVKEIDANYPMQSVSLDGMSVKIRFNNDLRTNSTFMVSGSFVDGNPIDEETSFDLKRRDVIEVIPSNVRSRSLIKNGSAKFGSLLIQ